MFIFSGSPFVIQFKEVPQWKVLSNTTNHSFKLHTWMSLRRWYLNVYCSFDYKLCVGSTCIFAQDSVIVSGCRKISIVLGYTRLYFSKSKWLFISFFKIYLMGCDMESHTCVSKTTSTTCPYYTCKKGSFCLCRVRRGCAINSFSR